MYKEKVPHKNVTISKPPTAEAKKRIVLSLKMWFYHAKAKNMPINQENNTANGAAEAAKYLP